MTIEAIPYKRYSSGKQHKGHSLERQGDKFLARCAEMRWLPNTTLNLDDKACSAFRGANANKGRLGEFRQMLKAGLIKPGSVLFIENSDRLSRQQVDLARELMRELLLGGLNIWDDEDGVLLTRDSLNDPLALIRMILRMERAHKESVRKSGFSIVSWNKLHKAAGQKIISRWVPFWLTVNADKTGFVVDEVMVAAVQQMFAWCIDGVGAKSIAQRLNAAGRVVPTRSKNWSAAVVYNILTGRHVLGEFVPHSGRGKDRKPCGEPIPNYYPQIVPIEAWRQAQRSIKGRSFGGGRTSTGVTNLFAKIIRNARDGCTMTYIGAKQNQPYARLISTGSQQGATGSDPGLIHYAPLEYAILSRLYELEPASVFPDHVHEDTARLKALDQRLKDIKTGLENIQEMIAEDPANPQYMRTLRTLVGQQGKAKEEFEEAAAKCSSPDTDQLRSVQEMLQGCEGGFNPTDTGLRLRLRSTIRRIVGSIMVLRVHRQRVGLCAIQIWFADGKRQRSYLCMYEQAVGNNGSVKRDPGQWQCKSLSSVAEAGELDLRKTADVGKLEMLLTGLDLEMLRRAMIESDQSGS